jgi:3-oxoacyl-[acyl-carrier protein] reductase
MDLTNKIAVITGSSRGIGNAIAKKLAEYGATTVINGTSDASRVERVAEEIKASGHECLGVLADISTQEGVSRLFSTAVEKYGRIDILVNNAGITRDNLVLRMSEEDWDTVLDTNLKSVFLCTKAALRYMIKQRWGRIINMSSIVGISGNAGQANYAASKAGIIGFTRAVAREVGSRGITVNSIAPGYIETDMTLKMDPAIAEKLKNQIALGKPGTPDDIAEIVAFLVSDKAGYITGHVLNVDGGMSGV